jgi:hypothetical protein
MAVMYNENVTYSCTCHCIYTVGFCWIFVTLRICFVSCMVFKLCSSWFVCLWDNLFLEIILFISCVVPSSYLSHAATWVKCVQLSCKLTDVTWSVQNKAGGDVEGCSLSLDFILLRLYHSMCGHLRILAVQKHLSEVCWAHSALDLYVLGHD